MRYRVDNVPAVGMGAFMPGLTLNGVSYGRGLTRITAVPGGAEVAIADRVELSPLGYEANTQPSNAAPDVICPELYLARTDNMGPWAQRGAMATIFPSDNVLPMPASSFGVVPAVQFRPAKIGGSKVIGWPRVAPAWQTVGST